MKPRQLQRRKGRASHGVWIFNIRMGLADRWRWVSTVFHFWHLWDSPFKKVKLMCHHKDSLKMRPGNFGADNTPQDFYFMDDHPTMLGWFKEKSSFVNVGFGCRKGWTHNAKGSNVWQEKLIAVVVSYYSHSLISRTKSLTWRNTSPLGVTSVISIPNITVSWTLLNSTGELRSWYVGAAQRQETWRRWKRM